MFAVIKKELVLMMFAILFSLTAVTAEQSHIKSQKFGYRLGESSFIIVELSEDLKLSVWIQDPRISSVPLAILESRDLSGLKNIQLPRPDFISNQVAIDQQTVIEFSDNLGRNLISDLLFVIPIQRAIEGLDKPSVENIILPLKQILRSQRPDSYNLKFLPIVSNEFPYRRIQVLPVFYGEIVVNVIDSNHEGKSKSATFLIARRDLYPNTFYFLDDEWIDLGKINGSALKLESLGDKLGLISKKQIFFHLGNEINKYFDLIKFQPDGRDDLQKIDSRSTDYRMQLWEDLKVGYAPLNHDLVERKVSYDVIDFIAKNGYLRSITPEAFKALTSVKTGGKAIAKWEPHQKLQVSSLGIMTYQDFKGKQPLFLGFVGDNKPISLEKAQGLLKVIFDNGKFIEYDLSSGAQYNQGKLCMALFL